MNRRVLLFFVCVFTTLSLMQIYFERKRWDHSGQVAKERKNFLPELSEKTLLPPQKLATFVHEGEKASFARKGVQLQEGVWLLFSLKEEEMADELVLFERGEERKSVKKIFEREGAYAFYSAEEDSTLKTIYLDPIVHNLPLWYLSIENSPLLQAAEYLSGQLLFEEQTHPAKDGVVLSHWKGSWIPVGFYQAESWRFFPFGEEEGLQAKLSWESLPIVTESSKEEFHLLENASFQLLFTTQGGAIREINLPFQGEEGGRNVVKEIGFDRFLYELAPHQSHFPLYSAQEEGGRIQKGGYYPLLRRGLLNERGEQIKEVSPHYFSMNIISPSFPKLQDQSYRMVEKSSSHIVFELVQARRTIRKTFTLPSQEEHPSYLFHLEIEIEGDSKDLWLTSGVPEVEIISGSAHPVLKYRTTRKGRGQVQTLKHSESKKIEHLSLDWVCNGNGFFGLLIDPLSRTTDGFGLEVLNPEEGDSVPSRLFFLRGREKSVGEGIFAGHQFLLPLQGGAKKRSFRIFAGPFSGEILSRIDGQFANKEEEYTPNYSSCTSYNGFFSWISGPVMKLFVFLMRKFHFLTHSWTFSIFLLTFLLRLLLYPLNHWSFRSMRKMKEIAPEVSRIQKEMAQRPKEAQIAIMQLYRKNRVNPMGGCFPLLIQFPFLCAMFDLLKSMVELRGEPVVTGWIDDMASPDVLFRWESSLPIIGREFHLLPLLLVCIMWLQQRISSPLGQGDSAQQKQQRTIGNFMNILFAIMFYNFPAGLNIYWISSMLLGILQQWWMNRSSQPQPISL